MNKEWESERMEERNGCVCWVQIRRLLYTGPFFFVFLIEIFSFIFYFLISCNATGRMKLKTKRQTESKKYRKKKREREKEWEPFTVYWSPRCLNALFHHVLFQSDLLSSLTKKNHNKTVKFRTATYCFQVPFDAISLLTHDIWSKAVQ